MKYYTKKKIHSHLSKCFVIEQQVLNKTAQSLLVFESMP